MGKKKTEPNSRGRFSSFLGCLRADLNESNLTDQFKVTTYIFSQIRREMRKGLFYSQSPQQPQKFYPLYVFTRTKITIKPELTTHAKRNVNAEEDN